MSITMEIQSPTPTPTPTPEELFLQRWFEIVGAAQASQASQASPASPLCEIRPLNKRPGRKPLAPMFFSYARTAVGYVRRALENGDDAYVGALSRTRRGGKESDVGALSFVFADVDYGSEGHAKPCLHATRDAALARITEVCESLRVAPTFLVDTGGGFHVWLALAEPGTVTETDWRDAIRRFVHALGGDLNATDRARILRVPGTLNFKTDPPRPVTLVSSASASASASADTSIAIASLLRLPQVPDARVASASASASASAIPRVPSATRAVPPPVSSPFGRANDVPVHEVLAWLGVPMHREGARTYCACPVHGGHNRSQMIVGAPDDESVNSAHCFGDCGRSYTPVDLVAAVRSCQPRDAVNLLAERFGFDGFGRPRVVGAPQGPQGHRAARAPVQSVPPSTASSRVASDEDVDSPAAFEGDDGAEGAGDGDVGHAGHAPLDWQERVPFTRDRFGSLKNTFGNVVDILRCAPEHRGRYSYNEMALYPCRDGETMLEPALGQMRLQIERGYGFSPSTANLAEAVLTVASDNSFHPVRRYLTSLRWDGRSRISELLGQVLPVRIESQKDRQLKERQIRAWFISAVARVMDPGCKVDSMLVLVGPQGTFKSTFFSALASREWFADTHMNLSDVTDSAMKLRLGWIYEWGEIEKITGRRGADEIKAFLSTPVDMFRVPYGRIQGRVPRTSVIVGTTNEDEFLADRTGSRRFWIFEVQSRIGIAAVTRDRDQLWAEAVAMHRAGEAWWLGDDDEQVRAEQDLAHFVGDPWEDQIASWARLATCEVSTARILAECLNLDVRDRTRANEMRVAGILHRLGWKKVRVRREGTLRRFWQRDPEPPPTETGPDAGPDTGPDPGPDATIDF